MPTIDPHLAQVAIIVIALIVFGHMYLFPIEEEDDRED